MSDETRERLRKRLKESRDPLKETSRFLKTYWSDADNSDEVKGLLSEIVESHPGALERALNAMETILASGPEPDVLMKLVLQDANRGLEPETFEEAQRWFDEAISMLRDVLES